MSVFKIEVPRNLDLEKDSSWILDEDGKWHFKPLSIDLKNQSMSAYWYCKDNYFEEAHWHSGTSLIQVLVGDIILYSDNQELHLHPGDSILLPSHTLHAVRITPKPEGVLLFILSNGTTHYPENKENDYDLTSYALAVKNHYQQLGLPLASLISE